MPVSGLAEWSGSGARPILSGEGLPSAAVRGHALHCGCSAFVGLSGPGLPTESRGNPISKAFSARIELNLRVSIGQPALSEIPEGSFYLLGLEVEDVTVIDPESGQGALLKKGKKPVSAGRFWEEYLVWKWGQPDEDGAFELTVSGSFAFEFSRSQDLERYTIDDGDLVSAIIGHASDGDSPKQLASIHQFSGQILDVEDHDEFDEF